MIGKLLSHLIGNVGDDDESTEDTFEHLTELEEGGWIIVNLAENGSITVPDPDPLEQMLIEHPSMSVYQRRCGVTEEEEEEEEPLDTDEDLCRSGAGRRLTSWHPAVWGVPRPCSLPPLTIQRARSQWERKKLSRGALHRQNLAKVRGSLADRRYAHFKQPSQRLHNY